MFFAYPVSATTENWLHECLCEMVSSIHACIAAGVAPPSWPTIIPVARRQTLRLRLGLRDRLRHYANAVALLSQPEREQVLLCIGDQNEVAKLVGCQANCVGLDDLPNSIRGPASQLFQFAFSLLVDLGIRDRHYRAIYEVLAYKVCPFCGSEYFDAPGAPREDLDHYLASSLYPFAAVNLNNLAPMGMKCNARHKLAIDILRDKNGVRRCAFNPYGDRKVRISLLQSVPFGAADGQTPAWQIEFVPDSPECTTWDDVFHIRERLQRDILDQSFRRWLLEFAAWYARTNQNMELTNNKLTHSVREHVENMALQGFSARDFLRVHVFEMLLRHCEQGNQRLLDFVRSIITQSVPQKQAA